MSLTSVVPLETSVVWDHPPRRDVQGKSVALLERMLVVPQSSRRRDHAAPVVMPPLVLRSVAAPLVVVVKLNVRVPPVPQLVPPMRERVAPHHAAPSALPRVRNASHVSLRIAVDPVLAVAWAPATSADCEDSCAGPVSRRVQWCF